MKIHIADDHNVIIDGYRALLTDYNIVGSSNNGKELIAWLEHNTTDIIILDISMPVMNGIEVLEYFHANNLTFNVIVVSAYYEVDYIKKCINNGAKSFISKDLAATNIIEAIETIKDGGIFFSYDVQEELTKTMFVFKDLSDKEFSELMLKKTLSKQEINVIYLQAKEYKPQQIADELNIDLSTIRTHRYRVKNKLIPNIGFKKLKLNYLKK